VGELVAQGNDSGAKELPSVADSGNIGFCNRLSDLYNTTGTPDCTKTTTSGFSATNANFITTNGMRFYNLGTNAIGSGATGYFTIYVDIDGSKRTSTENVDVLQFRIYLSGLVLPYDNASTSTSYLSTSVRYWNGTAYAWLKNSVSYKESVCVSGQFIDAGYCGSYTKDSLCDTNVCEIVINKPKFLFF
ncbi:MAG: hypothetical protein PHC64_05810, partial [Candidatus Gastranaerophilales bacterium]|nr:hypothetical protein [Candidatus Gastranaerophilales bacterium]